MLRRACWSALVLLTLAGCGNSPTSPEDTRADTFDQFWRDFDRNYSYFEYKHIDWDAVRTQLRERAIAAPNDTALIAVLHAAVQPLRDVHVWFRRPDGSALPTYIPPRARNWERATWQSYLPALGWRQGVSNWGWGRVGDVGYLVIGAWSDAQVKIDDVDAALEQLRDTRALVLDVRMNGGGNDALALQLAGRFAAQRVRFGAVRYRSGPKHTDFTAWHDRYVAPRGTWQYQNPVYLLVGAGCFSSNETFIAAMGELPNVTVAGDTTGGSSGNPREFSILLGGRESAWRFTVPQWMEVLADGTMVEWNGIAPDVVVPFNAPGRDPVLEWAFARAGVTLSPPPAAPRPQAARLRAIVRARTAP